MKRKMDIDPRWFLVAAAVIGGLTLVVLDYQKTQEDDAYKIACAIMGGSPLITDNSRVCFKDSVILSVN